MSATFPKAIGDPVSVAVLLERLSERPATVIGDASLVITHIDRLDRATPGCLAFCRESRPAKAAELIGASGASVVVGSIDLPPQAGRCFLRVEDPRAFFLRALDLFFPKPAAAGIHPSAEVGEGVSLGEEVEIGCHAILGDRVRVGDGTVIGPGVYVHAGTEIGRNCVIQANTTIGGSGMAFRREAGGLQRGFPHLGRVLIEDNVEIATNCSIVRGILEDTVIGRDSKIGNLVNIGHNCKLGHGCWISSSVLLCGDVTLESGALISPAASITDKVTVGAGARVGMGSVVTKNVPPGKTVFGMPAKPLRTIRPI